MKKLTLLPSGSANSRDRFPHGLVVGAERGRRKGEIPSKVDASTMVAELVGPLFYRRWFSREALDEKFVKSVIRNVVLPQSTRAKCP